MRKISSYVFAFVAASAFVTAQEKPEGPKATSLKPLKVVVVFEKFQGEKKVASFPYTVFCNAGESETSRLSMGIDVPIFTQVNNAPQVVFKRVGTTLSIKATQTDPGLFLLDVDVQQSAFYAPEGRDGSAHKPAPGDWVMSDAPLLRTFTAQFRPILRAGQSSEYAAATDPVSGEVVKINLTLNVAN